MKPRRRSHSLLVAMVTMAMLLLIAAVVFGLGDRSTLVPAPEVVSESLLRQLATHRSQQTAQLVSDAAGMTLDSRSLRAWFEGIEDRTGPVQRVEGRDAVVRGDTAEAIARLTGETGTVTCDLTLVRRHGLWLVTGIRVR